MSKKTISILLLSLISVFAVACGSEPGNAPELPTDVTPPGLDTPPGPPSKTVNPVDVPPGTDPDAGVDPADGGDQTDGGDTDGGDVDPDAGTDPTDGGGGDTDGGAGDQDGGVVVDPPPPPPTSVVVGCVQIDLASAQGNTFCYQLTELEACKDLSHWDLATNCTVLGGTPESGLEVGTDPKSGLTGVKWDVSDEFMSGEFCLTVDGQPTLATGEVQVASKSGKPISYGVIAGPLCQ